VLIQSLVLIASLVLISGAIILSALTSAKITLQQTVLAKSQTAMTEATRDFVTWAAAFVAQNGTEQKSAAWTPPSTPVTEYVCPSGAENTPPDATTCNYLATITWKITGSTADGPPTTPGASTQLSTAENLATTVDEQRISATIVVRLTNATGQTVLATRTLELTARATNVAPYVIPSGEREVGTAAADIHAAEGDTGGQLPVDANRPLGAPDTANPARYTDTRIHTVVDCINSTATFDETDPAARVDGNANGRIDYRFHPWGNQNWAYENPCEPSYYSKIEDSKNYPSSAQEPKGSEYATDPDPASSADWTTGEENTSAFAR
jgi:hypothetical protein